MVGARCIENAIDREPEHRKSSDQWPMSHVQSPPPVVIENASIIWDYFQSVMPLRRARSFQHGDVGDGIKDFVERLRGEMLARNLLYVEDFIVDLRSGGGQIEFRCGFALHADNTLRTFTVQGPAKAAVTDSDAQVIVEAVSPCRDGRTKLRPFRS